MYKTGESQTDAAIFKRILTGVDMGRNSSDLRNSQRVRSNTRDFGRLWSTPILADASLAPLSIPT